MEKQSYLPIKFFHKNGVQDYEKIKQYSGDWVVPQYPSIAFPGFQLVVPEETYMATWELDNFHIFLVEYDTGTLWDVLALDIKPPVLYNATDFWVLAMDTFPWESVPMNIDDFLGRFYYSVYYGEETDEIEIEWESEVFDICDMDLDATTEAFTNVSFDSFSSTRFGTFGLEYVEVEFCNLAGAATATMPIDCFPGKELDIYIRTLDHDGTPACASSQWDDDLVFQVKGVDSGRNWSTPIEVSNTDSQYYFRLEVEAGTGTQTGELLIEMSVSAATKGKIEIWVQRTWKANHVQLRYFNTRNFCKIVYEDDYETRFFLNAKQVIDNNQIEETTVEDDETNKYRIIGTNQVYNSVHFVGTEVLLNAMSLLRLHDNITIVQESGEPMDIVELLLEQTVVDFEAVSIKLIYREDSCSWTFCEFTTA